MNKPKIVKDESIVTVIEGPAKLNHAAVMKTLEDLNRNVELKSGQTTIRVPKRTAAEKRAARRHKFLFLNNLSLKKVTIARTVHCCALCMCPIEKGTEYRDGGQGRRAHEFCFEAVAREFK